MNNVEDSVTHQRSRTPRPRTDRDAYPLIEVADRLGGLSIRTIYNLGYRGELRLVRIGGKRMVLKSDLDAYLASVRGKAA